MTKAARAIGMKKGAVSCCPNLPTTWLIRPASAIQGLDQIPDCSLRSASQHSGDDAGIAAAMQYRNYEERVSSGPYAITYSRTT